MYQEERKPVVAEKMKSSAEILSELFSTFDVEPPIIIKKEKHQSSKKHKKSKKIYKHKEKKYKEEKHKKKGTKRTRNHSLTSVEDDTKIKEENLLLSKEIKAEDSYSGEDLTPEIKREKLDDDFELTAIESKIKSDTELISEKNLESKNTKTKIKIKRLKCSSIFEPTIHEMQEKQPVNLEEGEIQSSDETSKNRVMVKKKHKQTREKHKTRRVHGKDNSRSYSVDCSKQYSKKSKEEIGQTRSNNHSRSPSSDRSRSLSKEDEKKKMHVHSNDHSRLNNKKDEKEKRLTYSKERQKYSKDRSRSYTKQDTVLKNSPTLVRTVNKIDVAKRNKDKDDFYKGSNKHRDCYESDKHNKDQDYHKSSQKENSRSRSRDRKEYKHHGRSENPFYKDSEGYRSKERSYDREQTDGWVMKDKYRSCSSRDDDYDRRYRDGFRERDHIDKKKLLQIARKNAIHMMKSGNLPVPLTIGRQAQEKVLAAIRAGGKTIKELTDFCKAISNTETREISGESGNEDHDSDCEHTAFNHPFQIKDKPSVIVMNIKNAIQLPTKSTQERNTELRLQFPVSSGSQHRKTEQWQPVSPKKSEVPSITNTQPPEILESLATEASPPVEQIVPVPVSVPAPEAALVPASESQVFSSAVNSNIDIGQVVSQRLSAMRKLQENPNDIEALCTINKSQKEMQNWAESKQVPGQFTGSTGANILSQAELAAGYQAWARKDQLQNAAPLSGGMGMHLLKKMGWNPGEGLGKDKSGSLQPLLLEVKLNKKGLDNIEEKRNQGPIRTKTPKFSQKSLFAKHPVSLLGEFTAKKKLGAPEYTLCLEAGPDHKKMFLFEVNVNGLVCKPEIASPNKKQAKADAAKLCLQKLGILAATPPCGK